MQDAAHWNFVIIGEALNQLRKFDPQTVDLITEWKRIIAFRNQLIHGYGVIEARITWDIITAKLPRLHDELTHLLDDLAP